MIWYTLKQTQILSRGIVLFSCAVLGFILYVNGTRIKDAADNALLPYVLDSYNVSQLSIQNINNTFDYIISTTPVVRSVMLYKFVQDKNTAIYNGRVGITSTSRFESDVIIAPTTSRKIPMQTDINVVQNLLLNNSHYETYDELQKNCSDTHSNAFECKSNIKSKGNFSAVFTLPLFDKEDYSVKGYISFLLLDELDKDEQAVFVKSMAPYVEAVAVLVKTK